MYCSSCGREAIQGVQYCKRCGANLIPALPSTIAGKPKGLVWIVAFGIAMIMGVPMGGIAVVFERVPELLERGFPLLPLMILAILSLLMVSGALVLLSRLLAPVLKTYLGSNDLPAAKRSALIERAPSQISAPRESLADSARTPLRDPMISVTEGTTRELERLHRDPDTH